MRTWKSFLWLLLTSMASIFLHELAHHLLGIPSLMSLSRNYPLVAVTAGNTAAAIAGTLAGPGVNLVAGYVGLLVYRISQGHDAARSARIRMAGLLLGIGNLFLTLSGAVINLIVDLVSGSPGNDLQQVSLLLHWPVPVLPALFTALSLPGFVALYRRWDLATARRWTRPVLVFGAWLLGGALLMLIDGLFQVRFALI